MPDDLSTRAVHPYRASGSPLPAARPSLPGLLRTSAVLAVAGGGWLSLLRSLDRGGQGATPLALQVALAACLALPVLLLAVTAATAACDRFGDHGASSGAGRRVARAAWTAVAATAALAVTSPLEGRLTGGSTPVISGLASPATRRRQCRCPDWSACNAHSPCPTACPSRYG